MESRRSPTDLTNEERGLLEPYLPASKRRGRPRLHSPHEILNAVFRALKSGCQWRMGKGVAQGRAKDGPEEVAHTSGLREPSAPVGRGAHLRVAFSQPTDEQGPREAVFGGRGVRLRGDDAAHGEEAGPCLRIFRRSRRNCLENRIGSRIVAPRAAKKARRRLEWSLFSTKDPRSRSLRLFSKQFRKGNSRNVAPRKFSESPCPRRASS